MESKKIEFALGEDKSLSFESQHNEVLSNASPFKEILNKSDYSDLSFSFDDNKDQSINFEDLFQLRVNVKEVGGFDLLFKQVDFNKEEIIKQIIVLKEMQVDSLESAKEKVSALFNIFSNNPPLFVCYSPKGEYQISLDDVPSDTFLFLVKPVEKPKPIKQEKTPKASNNSSFFGRVLEFFSPIATNPVHYLFILISSFLIGFSSSIGIYYCYVGNNVFYFLFVCSLVGALLNFFVYSDYFKQYSVISKETALTAIDVLIGIGLSIGSFFIFYVVQKEKPTSLKSPLTILLIMSAVIILVNVLTCSLAFLFKKGKAKKEETK